MRMNDILASKSPEKREQVFRTLIEKSADAIQLIDTEGRILYSSDSVKTVLGYEPAEIQGKLAGPYVHPDDIEGFGEVIAEVVKKDGNQGEAEYRVKHKDGSWVWVQTTIVNHLDDPDISALVGNFRNITKRRETEAALRESETRLRFIAESMPQKIFMAEPSGKVVYYNPQWAEYTGLTIKQMLNEGWGQFVHPDDKKVSEDVWRQSLKTGEAFQIENRYRNRDGEYRRHLNHVVARRNERDEIVMWVGSNTDIEDITQARIREENLQIRANSLDEQRTKLIALNDAKDEFISLASHQLRTPATGVKQYIGMLLEGFVGELEPKQMEILRTAYRSNERQLQIINDLLDVAKADAGKVELVPVEANLVEMLYDVVKEHLSSFHDRHQVIVINDPPDEIVAFLDAKLIRMVIENILDNASKYTPEGGKVQTEIEEREGMVFIRVIDNGVGMTKKDQSKLFQRFSRIDNPLSAHVGGSGLGLYWAKKVIELHNGSIEVESKKGHGTTFTLILPKSVEA
jgi:PAS domain S-box-containing protein